MKSLNQAGVSVSGRWSRWVLCFALAVAAAGCGGGSDPLDIGDSGGTSSSPSLSQDQLVNAYNKVTCGMTGEQTQDLVGAKTDIDFFSWTWKSDDGAVKLEIQADRGATASEYLGFPDDGYYRSVDAYLTYVLKGQTSHRRLCRE